MSKAPRSARSAREQALLGLMSVDEGGGYANLSGYGQQLTVPAERALANELLQGVTRRRGALDWVLAQLLKDPIEKLTPPIRNILRLGAYQLLFLDKIPASAAVDESVKLAHRYGHAGVAKLVNGVLRNLGRRKETLIWPTFDADPLGALMHRYSLPEWLAKRWLAAFGNEAEAIAAWSVAPPRLALRTNTLATSREALLAALSEAQVPAEPSTVVSEGVRLQGTLDVTALPGYNEGWWYVQDEAAMLVSRCLDPKPGETVIDVGAAPGGKTTHLAQLMGNQGEIWAVDQRAGRLKLLEDNLNRLAVTNVRLVEQDAVDLTGLPQADRILLDVPCSGLGVLPRKPDIRWRQSPDLIAQLGKTQRQMLDAAAVTLKPGGTMLYSTCTIGKEENQDVIKAFLADHPEFALGALADALPESWRQDIEEGGMIQLLPHRHGVDGFFLAKLEKH